VIKVKSILKKTESKELNGSKNSSTRNIMKLKASESNVLKEKKPIIENPDDFMIKPDDRLNTIFKESEKFTPSKNIFFK